jgi:arylsulfatase
MPVGEIGIPALQKNRGFETPVMNEIAEEGILFTRMMTEPSCTPSRAADMTGRYAVRSGMYNVAFPYEYGGIGADEVTMAEVLSEAGYAPAFYGKWHLGDVESSYCTNQGFDEALWTPYNQVPSLYVRRGQQAPIYPTSMYPDMYPEDKYALDNDWIPNGFVWALEGEKGEKPKEWDSTENDDDYYRIDDECVKRVKAFMQKNKESKNPGREIKKTELVDNSVSGWFNKGPKTSGDGGMDCVEPIYRLILKQNSEISIALRLSPC